MYIQKSSDNYPSSVEPTERRTKCDDVVTILIKRPGKMTVKGRQEIAEWMREKADELVEEGDNWADDFSAHYWVSEK